MRPRKICLRSPRRFFTLPELLVVVVIILVLSLIAIPVIRSARVKAGVVRCMHNLRGIAVATSHYQREYQTYPPQPYFGRPLLTQTLVKFVDNVEVFRCPVDEEAADSYSDYYVTRPSHHAGDSLLVGCPRHDNQTLAVNVFKKGGASIHPLGQMYHSAGSQTEPIGAGEIVGSGTTWFPDGSSMTITTPGLEAEIVESFQLDSGQTYTLLKVPANDAFGRVILNVIPGSKFEVVTPAAIAGVRGTVFIVDLIPKNGEMATDVFVFEGEVAVTEVTGKGERLSSWAVPICAELAKPPYLCPDPVPALPGVVDSSVKKPAKIDRENPPWAMGKNPWPDGVPPWARAKGYREKAGDEPVETPPGLAKKKQGQDDTTTDPGNQAKDNGQGNSGQDKTNQPDNGATKGNDKKSTDTPGDGGSAGQTPPTTGDNTPPTTGPDTGQKADPDSTLPVDDQIDKLVSDKRLKNLPEELRPVYRRYALVRGNVLADAPWGSLGFLAWLITILRALLGI